MSRCRMVELKRVDETRGSLVVTQVDEQIDFTIQRSYWIFDVPEGGERAHHAHREQDELLVAVQGSFNVHCDDGREQTSYRLDSPAIGLLIPRLVYHHLDDFAAGSVCLVFASGLYDPEEYVTELDEFRRLTA